ncbi:H+/Cl- antiporter ClcA [Oikeobacillus pervagus]|uniref:H+/Cl- antiporter ClcA n=1 Tax=Oikeobacillus pervagus TaxID=1325931 RepID=A0AAJ1T612_9BACI|nr:chloride channel protein [Oikeobacillus pervagus]MDQ0215360.1 H+/Cl- antiporter ClcA [Oikeobacillus pervagus]
MFRIYYIEPFIMLATLIRWLILSTITGAIVGTGTSLFLHILHYSTDQTAHIPLWMQMMLLPIGGIINGLIIYYGYRNASKDKKDSVIAAVHEQAGLMPYKTLPLKPIAAIITLGSGGSAGKEGPCSHIGGTLASWFGYLIHLNPELQKRIVACGISAGFASVFGTPIAGAIYGIEILTIGRLRYDYIFPAIIAGVTSYEVSKFWGITYTFYPIGTSHFSEGLFMKIILIGIICGLIAWLFIEMFEQVRAIFQFVQQRFQIWPPLMPMLGGLLLSILIIFIPTDYLGLSLPLMDQALQGEATPLLGFFWKSLLVAITLGSGFYGGIVTPQFVIGALSGNAFAHLLNVDPVLGAAVGMVAVVASASNTPLAAIFMGYELFGSLTGLYVVGACITAYIIIGHRSVYPDQLVAYSKSLWMHLEPNIPLKKEKIHVSYGLLRKMKRWQYRRK